MIASLSLLGMFHALAAMQPGDRKVFTNSVTPLPQEAAASMRLPQPAHLSEMMEIEIPLQMRSYPRLVENIAREKKVSQARMEKDYLPLPADYELVKKWLVSEGFQITKTDPDRLALFAKGTIAQIQKSLQVEMVHVTVNGKDYHAAHTHPSLPREIAAPVLGVNGLQPYVQMRKLSPTTAYAVPYSVNDILTAYNAKNPGVNGAGQKIAILIDTIPSNSDLTAFWSRNNIPQSLSNIEEINVNNVSQYVLTAATGEETLDVEWSSAMAPAAKVRVYAAGTLDNPSLDKGLLQIISDLPTQPQLHQLSISIGEGETDLMSTSQMQTDAQYFATIAAGGVTIFAASGDGGSTPDSNGGNRGPLQVEYYASDPNVTGVGGTTLTMSPAGSVTNETGWSYSGGGVSQVFTRPAWQTGSGVPAGTMRLVPDVSFVGNPNTGAYVYFGGTVQTYGGTSLGTPIWAGICALINQARANAGQAPIGLLGPNIYPLIGTNNFRDITSGRNGTYSAGSGYDEVTGIGVPNVGKLIATLAGTNAGAPSITAFSPVTGPVSSSVSLAGMNFDNVTAVLFNGVSASFAVNSSTQITATVPAGASTGLISIITSTGSVTGPGSFAVATGTTTTLYSTGFESSQGYVAGLLSGQNGWVKGGSGGNGVTVDFADTVFSGYGNQASIGYTAPTSGTMESLWQPVNYSPTAGEIINFSVLADVIDSIKLQSPRDRFRWSVYNIEGARLFSIEFDNSTNDINYILDDNVTHLIGNLFSNGTLFSIQMTIDFARNAWTATLNGSTLATNQPVTTGTASLNLGSIRAEWVLNSTSAGNNYMLFDNYSITKSNVVLSSYTVDASASPIAGGSAEGSGTYSGNSLQTVTAVANSGYTFSSWTENGGYVSASPGYSFTLDRNRTLVANFISDSVVQTGSLQVIISPPGAVTAGAQWQVDSGTWLASGTSVAGLLSGTHTVVFSNASGWVAPNSKTVVVNPNLTTIETGTYVATSKPTPTPTPVPTRTGSLQVSLSPAGAVSAGALWQVDGNSWRSNGVTTTGLSPGNHTVNFSAVNGWLTPPSQTVKINSGAMTATSGTYSGNGQVSIVVAENDLAPGVSGGKFLLADNPAVDSLGDVAFKASVTGVTKPSTISSTNNIGIWYYTGSSATLLARTGAPAPGTLGAVFASLGDPALHEDGSLVFTGGLGAGDVLKNKSNAAGVWLTDSQTTVLVVRSGSSAADQPDGQYKLFEQIVTQTATDTAFLATLAGTGVTPQTNTGLWGSDLSGTLHSIIRTGESIATGTGQRTVAAISVFPIPTKEQGQSRSIDTVDGHLAFGVTFTDKSSAICAATPQASGFALEIVAATWNVSVPGVPQTQWSAFGNPAVNANGTVAFKAMLVGAATKPKSSGLWLDSGTATTLMALSGQAAPDCGGALFATFEDPVLNHNDQIAFIGSLQAAKNWVTAKTASGIWTNTSGTMQLLARTGSDAPGVAGGQFSEFDQIVLPDVGGPIFLAKLTGVKATANTGVWCVGVDGEIHLLFQTGDKVSVHGAGKVISSFTLFAACPQVAGQSRNFDALTRAVVFLATFSDRTWAIIQTVAP